MKDLIEKLEKATEGSRELDCWIAVNPNTPNIGVRKRKDTENKKRTVQHLLEPRVTGIADTETEISLSRYLPVTNADDLGVPPYTTSLDATLTLVPDGYDFAVGTIDGKSQATILWTKQATEDDAEKFGVAVSENIHWNEHAKASTPALALVIAALKVLEQQP